MNNTETSENFVEAFINNKSNERVLTEVTPTGENRFQHIEIEGVTKYYMNDKEISRESYNISMDRLKRMTAFMVTVERTK